MSDAIYLYDQGFIDPESITFPINRRLKEDGSPLEIIDFDVANEELMKDFLEATKIFILMKKYLLLWKVVLEIIIPYQLKKCH